jgi:tRNA dimethylallyltransferase
VSQTDAHGVAMVVGILGPSGVGKTAVAVELARRMRTCVISCDSMQLYQGFPVLTNQPAGEEATIHELVGCIDPSHAMSAPEYARLAGPLVRRELAGTGWALVAGGTGLYMRAALAPLAAAGRADPEIHRQLEERAVSEGPVTLHAELARLDPAAAESIDPRNVRRVVRALAMVQATGAMWSGRTDLWNPHYHFPTMIVGLVADRQSLYARINTRTAKMLCDGAVEEVRAYRSGRPIADTVPGGAGIRSAIGYREIYAYLEGAAPLEETISRVAAATRAYARRQLTWLRKLGDAIIVDVQGRSAGAVADEILAHAGARRGAKESGDT